MSRTKEDPKDYIELLSVDLLKDTRRRKLVERWSKVLGRELGWHYILDLIWIVKQVEESGIPRDSVILDAGAGTGLSQFLLASLGYNVLSVDYKSRNFPVRYRLVFRIKNRSDGNVADSSYIEHVSEKEAFDLRRTWDRLLGKWNKLMGMPLLTSEALKFEQKNRYGEVSLYQEDLKDLRSIPSNSVDCVVSVSAIEHNDFRSIGAVISELGRVTKRGASMFITTSAVKGRDWFHEPAHGWCFSEATLARLFHLINPKSNFDRYDEFFADLVKNEYLRNNLSRFYLHSGKGGLPWGEWNPLYYPVGVVKYNR